MNIITKLCSGRINRKQFFKRYFLYHILLILIACINYYLLLRIRDEPEKFGYYDEGYIYYSLFFALLGTIPYILFLLSCVVKRFHDFNKSGKYPVIFWLISNSLIILNPDMDKLILTTTIIFNFTVGLIPGNKDTNIYGEPPSASKTN